MEGFQSLLQQAQKAGLVSQTRVSPSIPLEYWCGNYLDPVTKQVIPDGNFCCFMHWKGLPTRWGVRHPFYSWQEDLLRKIKQGKRLFYIRKPPKIGATETVIGLGEHLSMIDEKWQHGQVGFVVGTGKNEATNMIQRCKDMLEIKDARGKPLGTYKYPIDWDYNTKTEFSINTVEFKAFPAQNKHIDAIRSQPNMKMIIADEAGFFTDVDQQEIRDALEHYVGGSDYLLFIITTAGRSPQGFAYDIEKEEESMYEKILLDYRAGLEVHPQSLTSLYRKADIDEMFKKNPASAERNFLGKWGHGAGDIFDTTQINYIAKFDYEFPKRISTFENALIVDPAYGEERNKTSSKFAGLGLYKQDGKIWTRSYFELTAPSDTEGIQRIQQELDSIGYSKLVVDGHYTGIIKEFRDKIPTKGFDNSMKVEATDKISEVVRNDQLRIHPMHEELARQMRAIKHAKEGGPDKKRQRYDLGDCAHMGIWELSGGKNDYQILPIG